MAGRCVQGKTILFLINLPMDAMRNLTAVLPEKCACTPMNKLQYASVEDVFCSPYHERSTCELLFSKLFVEARCSSHLSSIYHQNRALSLRTSSPV